MKIAIIGSRGLNLNMEEYLPDGITLVISGGAVGIDSIAEKYAKEHNIPTLIFLPEYSKYGKSAPLVRNKLIVDNAEIVIAFWDGESRGTKFTIEYAQQIGKKVIIHTLKK